MLSAIISDTLLLKSPTTTDKDKKAVAELVNIAGVDLSKYGLDMLKAGTNLDKYTEKELINLDAKTMEKEDVKYIIAQVNTVSIPDVLKRKEKIEAEINKEIEKKNKVLVTTLTKKMAEDLTDYMREVGIRVKYLHSDIDTLERTEIIRDMRLDVFDVLVGINLLREGLDIPEITLVAILDADKEGFLRSETSLIQTIGRAARNSEGHVIMYADTMTESMQLAIDETQRRREIQMQYNKEHGITPKTIQKSVRDLISISKKVAAEELKMEKDPESMSRKELEKLVRDLEKQMKKAAAELNFEVAAELRDKLIDLKKMLNDMDK